MERVRLSEEFIEKYRNLKPDFGPLGWVTYKRTYARWIESEGRTEEWFETVRRVIEGNFNITHLAGVETIDMAEMELAYDLMFRFCWLPPGRGLWQSGTAYAEKHGDSLYNCWQISTKPHPAALSASLPNRLAYNAMDPSFAFRFMLDISTKGGGVGFNAQRRNTEMLPEVKQEINLKIVCRESHPDYEKLKPYLSEIPRHLQDLVNDRLIEETHLDDAELETTHDSREGWVDDLGNLMLVAFNGNKGKDLWIDISDIREDGAPIKTFGGVSAGPLPYVIMLREVTELLNARVGQKLSTVDAVDLENIVGKCVVSGGVRRTAQIAGGDIDDPDFITMKQDKEKLMSHRWASNNSVAVNHPDQLTDENLHMVAESIKVNGEPGVVYLWNVRNYGRMIDGFKYGVDGKVEWVNPCSEIGLEDGEACNLVEIFPSICLKNGIPLEVVARIATRYAKRVTFVHLDWAISREVMYRNRRLGISISGYQDWSLMVENVIEKLDGLYGVVKDSDIEFSAQLGCSPSIKLTAIKPSGSISLLPGVSPGMHWHYAAYYIRRITFQEHDPLLPLLASKGFRVERSAYSKNAFVVEFPVKAATADVQGFMTAGEVPLRKQLECQRDLQWYWADNLVSCTATFQEHEKEEIEPLLKEFLPQLKSTSLLPYSGHGYEQAPYEPISVQEYEARLLEITEWPTSFEDKVNGLDMVDQASCESGGSCPIR